MLYREAWCPSFAVYITTHPSLPPTLKSNHKTLIYNRDQRDCISFKTGTKLYSFVTHKKKKKKGTTQEGSLASPYLPNYVKWPSVSINGQLMRKMFLPLWVFLFPERLPSFFSWDIISVGKIKTPRITKRGGSKVDPHPKFLLFLGGG